jgi:hypothetical protein
VVVVGCVPKQRMPGEKEHIKKGESSCFLAIINSYYYLLLIALIIAKLLTSNSSSTSLLLPKNKKKPYDNPSSKWFDNMGKATRIIYLTTLQNT